MIKIKSILMSVLIAFLTLVQPGYLIAASDTVAAFEGEFTGIVYTAYSDCKEENGLYILLTLNTLQDCKLLYYWKVG